MYSKSVPFWRGIRSVGMGASNRSVGTTRGTTPKMAYLATISATRASIGIAGYGMPLKSIQPITAVRSTPVMSRTSWLASVPGVTSCLVMIPSINTCGVPFTVATINVLMIGGTAPPASRKMVGAGTACSG